MVAGQLVRVLLCTVRLSQWVGGVIYASQVLLAFCHVNTIQYMSVCVCEYDRCIIMVNFVLVHTFQLRASPPI